MVVREIETIIVTDYCEENNQEETITIDYCNIPSIGTLIKEYKKGSFYCEKEENNECEYYLKHNHCSVYDKAPITKRF